MDKHSHGHHHHHSHSAHHHDDLKENRLLWATLLNLFITVVEIVGGLLSNSLALLSDAVHNLGDTLAIMLAWIANRIGKRSANYRKTFGYRRIEILAAFFNAVILFVIIAFLVREAIVRVQNPEPIKGMLMFIVASAGLLANLVAMLLLKGDSGKNINIRAAYLHLLGDTFSSALVIVGSVLIYFFEVYWIDPLLTIVIGLYIVKETFSILRQSFNILMQASPANISLDEVKKKLENLEGIDNIHHAHLWNLSDSQTHFECHVDVSADMRVSETSLLKNKIEDLLKSEFQITHVTLQFEFNCCPEKELIIDEKQ